MSHTGQNITDADPPSPIFSRRANRWTFRQKDNKISTHAPVAQLDRVSDSDSEGHRFDSCRVYHTPAVFTAGAFFPSAGVLPDANAACRPAGLRLRKRCRHFAVPSPLGLLTTPAGCTKPLPQAARVSAYLSGVFPLADASCSAAALHSAPLPLVNGSMTKFPDHLTFPLSSSLFRPRAARPYDSCRVYQTLAASGKGFCLPVRSLMPERNNADRVRHPNRRKR